MTFGFLVEASIGPEDQDGAESFGIQVCTPEWLRLNYSSDGAVFGRHMLIVFDYDLDAITLKISRYCERCVGTNWREIATQLAQIGQWEFERYQPAG